MISAEVVLASASEHAKPIYTLKCIYPWFIHGEVMTHRVFSRNASSNRAIPISKTNEEATRDDLRAEPAFWGHEQKGMEPGEELSKMPVQSGPHAWLSPHEQAQNTWACASQAAADYAKALADLGVHKSICNRLTMPFRHAHVIITATEWDNFFGLRLAPDADPTMRELAMQMHEAITIIRPTLLQPGEWHLPFITDTEMRDIDDRLGFYDMALKVSVARCARVSYESHETGRRSTVEEDLKLYDRLMAQGHWSPFEHQAAPDNWITMHSDTGLHEHAEYENSHEHGNFVGWRQFRKMMPGEAVKPLALHEIDEDIVEMESALKEREQKS